MFYTITMSHLREYCNNNIEKVNFPINDFKYEKPNRGEVKQPIKKILLFQNIHFTNSPFSSTGILILSSMLTSPTPINPF